MYDMKSMRMFRWLGLGALVAVAAVAVMLKFMHPEPDVKWTIWLGVPTLVFAVIAAAFAAAQAYYAERLLNLDTARLEQERHFNVQIDAYVSTTVAVVRVINRGQDLEVSHVFWEWAETHAADENGIRIAELPWCARKARTEWDQVLRRNRVEMFEIDPEIQYDVCTAGDPYQSIASKSGIQIIEDILTSERPYASAALLSVVDPTLRVADIGSKTLVPVLRQLWDDHKKSQQN